MNEGKHFEEKMPASGSRLRSRYWIGILLVLALLAAASFGGAYGAYAQLKDTTSPVSETYELAVVSCAVSEDYSVSNTGNIPALIRVTVVPNRVNDQGEIVAGAAALPALSYGADWTEIGGCRYYNRYVAPGEATTALLSEIPDGIQVVVLAEAVQATPADAVREAWGVQFDNGVWTAR